MQEKKPGRRRMWWWIAAAVLAVVLIPVAIVVVPILTHVPQGSSGQLETDEEWPTSVTARGDDGRTRTLSVSSESSPVDTSAIRAGQRLVVKGSGYDPSSGIYVAVCAIAEDGEKPHPCLGGVPDQEQQHVESGTVQWAPSNWINDDWAWKLFGARSYDDASEGTFTAYLEIADPVGEGIDCRVDACAVYTRNDHTALNDRVQDLYIPVGFTD